ncbi:DinB family protein [Hymenobacter sp. BT175]|uniref:DinB family protein n=1 Tax=Hymenobacter translucens TaxID=2886507 RepID=UPI001D0EB749|nr:DinB family protein [Hymenobacter translucens]MCC2546326.1 DinB family protein [Hymenobacter translucens]
MRPLSGHYPPYFENYFRHVPDHADPLTQMREQPAQLRELLGGLSDEQGLTAYAPGKWTIKELVLHMLDTERIFAYRALRFSRADATPLPGFEENEYVPNSGANGRTIPSLLREYDAIRQASITLFENLTPAQLDRVGTSNGQALSVRALLHVIPGHEGHHLQILRERYLPVLA